MLYYSACYIYKTKTAGDLSVSVQYIISPICYSACYIYKTKTAGDLSVSVQYHSRLTINLYCVIQVCIF
jgi:hypothetical protein